MHLTGANAGTRVDHCSALTMLFEGGLGLSIRGKVQNIVTGVRLKLGHYQILPRENG